MLSGLCVVARVWPGWEVVFHNPVEDKTYRSWFWSKNNANVTASALSEAYVAGFKASREFTDKVTALMAAQKDHTAFIERLDLLVNGPK